MDNKERDTSSCPFEELVATMVDDKQILDSITGLLILKRKSKEHDKKIVTKDRTVSQLFFIVITKVYI